MSSHLHRVPIILFKLNVPAASANPSWVNANRLPGLHKEKSFLFNWKPTEQMVLSPCNRESVPS